MSDTLIIRPMTEADLGRVYALEKVSHPVPWSQASLQRSFTDHYGFVLLKQQQLVGFALYKKLLMKHIYSTSLSIPRSAVMA